ncbi:MAG TPA: hypothetical protein VHJ18_10605 [Streptosporangiaceae bacterium]|jgi:hypothetical protein|nr:hypothetical protein [Streptosporangiaceae bacterium]
MSAGGHNHAVNSEGVTAARAGVLSVGDAGRLAGLLGMLADLGHVPAHPVMGLSEPNSAHK